MSAARNYAEAAEQLLERGENDAKVSHALITELKRKGMLRLLPSVVVELKRSMARAQKVAPRIEVARSKDEARAKKEAAALGIEGDVAVNASLISGWRALAKGNLVDRSGKHALVNLYRSVTR